MGVAEAEIAWTRTSDVNNWSTVTDPFLRAAAQAIKDLLVAAGGVIAADTGQVDLSLAWAAPTITGGSNLRGFTMFRFFDDLQATRPIFIRINWYVATTSITAGALNASYALVPFIVIYQATDGAGAGVGVSGPSIMMCGNYTTTTTTNTNYETTSSAIARTARACVRPEYFFLNLAETASVRGGRCGIGSVMVERIRDLDGTPNGDGVFFMATGSSQATFLTTGSAPFQVNACHNFLAGRATLSAALEATAQGYFLNPPVHTGGSGYASDGDVTVQPLLPADPVPRGQSVNAVAYSPINFAEGALIPITIHGVTRTYRCMGYKMVTAAAGIPIAVRYE